MNYIKFFDFLSTHPKLYVDQSIRYKNSIGGLFSLIIIIVTIIFTSLFIIDLSKRTNFRLIINEEMLENSKIDASNLPVVFELYNELGEPSNYTKRMISVEAKIINFYQNNKYALNSNFAYTSNIKIRNCSKINSANKFQGFINILKALNFNKYDNCLDLSNKTNIESNLNANKIQKILNINVNRCVNSTNNNNSCLSDFDIDKLLNKTQIVFTMPNFYLDNFDYESPGKFYLQKDIFNLNSNILKVFNYYLKEIEYVSENGLFLSEKKSKFFFKQKYEKNENYIISEEDNQSILKLFISMTNKKITYFRSYLKIQDHLASLMAFFHLLILIVKLILNVFIENHYLNYLCNYIGIFQKFQIDLLNKNIIKNKTRFNNFNFEAKSGNLINENSYNKLNIINNKDNLISLKEDPLAQKNVNEKNLKLNKFRIKSNKLNEPTLINNLRNRKHKNHRPSIFKNSDNNSKSNYNNVENIINIHIDKEKIDDIIIKDEKSFISENNVISKNFKSGKININAQNINNSNLNNVNITNLALISKNFNSESRIFKKPTTVFKINNTDLFKRYIFNCKTNRMKVMEIGMDYITKKLSIEEILRKVLDIDKLKFLTIDKEILDKYNHISGPNVFYRSEGKDFDFNNYIFNKSLIFDNHFIEELWNRYEFKDNFRKNQEKNKNLLNIRMS